ncbi:sensor histidine kinase [Nocardioides limicola]|uniref:sensor histidine kinase n=1 Tax=Nocardioides limicola TaxID=2803368 RepID=UPI00193BE196|nr:GAF domain-containing protein [Nocardioides sp. DJM-14]
MVESADPPPGTGLFGQGVLPSSALAPLAHAELSDLLNEVLGRVGQMMDDQRRLRLLLDSVTAIARDLSLDTVLERIVRSACDLVDCSYGALGVLGPGDERRLTSFVTWGLTAEEAARIGELPRGHGLLGLIIDRPEPVRLHDIADHSESYGFPPNHPPMRSFLGVPVRIRDQVFGNLYLTEKAGGQDFTEDDEAVVLSLATAAGVVIENARLYQEAERREVWLQATADITALLLGPVSKEQALQTVADRVRAVAGADVVTVVLTDSARRLRLHTVAGAGAEGVAGRELDPDTTLAGEVVRSGAPVVVSDLRAEAERASDLVGTPGWDELGPAVLVPMTSSVGVEGVLCLAWRPVNAMASIGLDVAMAQTLAEQAALALHVARARDAEAKLVLFEDRDRIARDLHDLVIQRLFGVGLALENTAAIPESAAVAQRLSEAVDNIDATIKEIRRSIFGLTATPGSEDVRVAVTEVVNAAAEALGFPAQLSLTGLDEGVLNAQVGVQLVAVTREALSNTARHARATQVEVRLDVAETVRLTVSDNGDGIEPGAVWSGLNNLKTRAEALGGTLALTGESGGTTLIWEVPHLSDRGAHRGSGARAMQRGVES